MRFGAYRKRVTGMPRNDPEARPRYDEVSTSASTPSARSRTSSSTSQGAIGSPSNRGNAVVMWRTRIREGYALTGLGGGGCRPVYSRAVVEGKTLAVVVPAYNEELLAVDTLRGMPDIVDRVYLVDDRSDDATVERVREYAATDPRVR